MEGQYLPFCDDFGIIGYNYVCPKCKHETKLTDCESGCEDCGFTEEYVDPDSWCDEKYKAVAQTPQT